LVFGWHRLVFGCRWKWRWRGGHLVIGSCPGAPAGLRLIRLGCSIRSNVEVIRFNVWVFEWNKLASVDGKSSAAAVLFGRLNHDLLTIDAGYAPDSEWTGSPGV
jgi:hypothetical protein